jgi:hypothetical protein
MGKWQEAVPKMRGIFCTISIDLNGIIKLMAAFASVQGFSRVTALDASTGADRAPKKRTCGIDRVNSFYLRNAERSNAVTNYYEIPVGDLAMIRDIAVI